MAISESLLMLAGFVLAHAIWSVSDLPEGELLVPLAIVEKAGRRQLLRFEAETQEQAVSKGNAMIKEHEHAVDAWAFAREGRMSESRRYVDVLTVEAKATGMREPVVFIQRFQPFSTGRFKLIGGPTVLVDSKSVSDDQSKRLIAQLLAGVHSHPKAAEHWREWTQ